MSVRYRLLDESCPNFITITVTHWVDVFIRPRYVQILDDALNYCIENKGLRVHAYVYMTSHIHLIVSAIGNDLSAIMRDFKKFTSKALVQSIIEEPESRRKWMLNLFGFEAKRTRRAENYKFWKDGYHPILLDTHKKIERRLYYLHYNPVAQGYVDKEEDWVNSSFLIYTDDYSDNCGVKVTPLW